jgi:uncharacterized delta-60 repeat protein
MTNFTPRRDYATSVELQTAGEIVVAGTADFNGQAARFALARYEADGTLDPAFGGDGKVTTNLTSGLDRAFGLAVQPADEMIVAVGWAGHRMGLVRYEPAGDLDPTFSGDGQVLTNFTAGVDYASGVEVQADGRIVIAGPANWTGRDTGEEDERAATVLSIRRCGRSSRGWSSRGRPGAPGVAVGARGMSRCVTSFDSRLLSWPTTVRAVPAP